MTLLVDRLRESIDSAAADRPFVAGFAAAAVANIALYVALWILLPTFADPIPLRYDAFGAIAVVGRAEDLIRLPMIGSLIIAANASLAIAAHRVDRPIAHVLTWSAVVTQTLLGGAIWVLLARASA
ncbi:MAG: hypothetical protein EPO26_14415 [Chloroflexota bacterium]|nr:MAG: hypothetical protein EPO26_14415 [Chloroflexota bacterium]